MTINLIFKIVLFVGVFLAGAGGITNLFLFGKEELDGTTKLDMVIIIGLFLLVIGVFGLMTLKIIQ
ncbi:MAG: hypothetical protein IJR70_06110 [Eubacterium sp.]|nr:hypothetical protein [Eubacterium sp.]